MRKIIFAVWISMLSLLPLAGYSEDLTVVSVVRTRVEGIIDKIDLTQNTMTIRYFESEQEGYRRPRKKPVSDGAVLTSTEGVDNTTNTTNATNSTEEPPEKYKFIDFRLDMNTVCLRGTIIVPTQELTKGKYVTVNFVEDLENPGTYIASRISIAGS